MSESLWWVIGILVVLILLVVVPRVRRRRVVGRRRALMRAIERERSSRVITLIHRREGFGLLGLPMGRIIDIEDSEQILSAIRQTPDETPIDLILHTPGGLVLASDQIAYALRRHKGRITVFVPHYAMSGGTLIALAADEIVMDRDAVLGPVDPQLGSLQHGYWPAASILAALEQPNANRDDDTLIMGDVARKAVAQVHATAIELLSKGRSAKEAKRLATLLSEGRWTHDYPIRFDEAGEIGLPVSDAMPAAIYRLMQLYPQRPQRRPSVEFIPWRRPPHKE